MDNDFKKLKSLEKPEVVYRGEGVNKYMKSTVAHFDDIASKNIGDIIIDPGYSYSSFNPVVAHSFLGDEMQKGFFIKLMFQPVPGYPAVKIAHKQKLIF